MAARTAERARTPSPAKVPLPGSPTFSYTTTANAALSTFNLPLPPPPRPAHAMLTKADLEQSQQAYSDLLATAKAYRIALASLSTSASAFGCALEACARLKESRADSVLTTSAGPAMPLLSNNYSMKATSCTADHLLSASGVHHLVANHQQILSETVYRSFEVPLLHDLDKWRRDIDDADEAYQKEVALRSREIRRLEKEGMKLHKQRRRDLSKFREHLVDLTSKLDGLSTLHGDHAQGLLRESQEASTKILDASCSLVRAEVDIFESLARKGWSGGGLDDLLERGRDLFAADDEATAASGASGSAAHDGTKLFSILSPKSILADAASDSSPRGKPRGRTRSGSLLSDGEQYQSLTGAVKDRGDTESIFSEFNQGQGRGVRPFSPQPIRRQTTDVTMDPESLLQGDDEFMDHRDHGEANGPDGGGEQTPYAYDDDDDHLTSTDFNDADHGEERDATQRLSNSVLLRDLRLNEDEGQAEFGTVADDMHTRGMEEVEAGNGSPWRDEGLQDVRAADTSAT